MGATSLVNMWKEGMGIDIEGENEGQGGENPSVIEHVGGGIKEPGEKQSSVV